MKRRMFVGGIMAVIGSLFGVRAKGGVAVSSAAGDIHAIDSKKGDRTWPILVMHYPEGTWTEPDGSEVPTRVVAQRFLNHAVAHECVVLPSDRDEHGNIKWALRYLGDGPQVRFTQQDHGWVYCDFKMPIPSDGIAEDAVYMAVWIKVSKGTDGKSTVAYQFGQPDEVKTFNSPWGRSTAQQLQHG